MSACAAMRGLSPVLALSDSGLGSFFNLSTSNKSNNKSEWDEAEEERVSVKAKTRISEEKA